MYFAQHSVAALPCGNAFPEFSSFRNLWLMLICTPRTSMECFSNSICFNVVGYSFIKVHFWKIAHYFPEKKPFPADSILECPFPDYAVSFPDRYRSYSPSGHTPRNAPGSFAIYKVHSERFPGFPMSCSSWHLEYTTPPLVSQQNMNFVFIFFQRNFTQYIDGGYQKPQYVVVFCRRPTGSFFTDWLKISQQHY